MSGRRSDLARAAGRLLGRAVDRFVRAATGRVRRTTRRSERAATEAPDVEYRPRDDDAADPGEIVWAWVPYDEGDGRGKDRPVLIMGRRGGSLLGLKLSSQDHDLDAADEARYGRFWTDIGTGPWDSRGRPSEVRLDRLLEFAPNTVRRIGAALDRERFDSVIVEARRVQGW